MADDEALAEGLRLLERSGATVVLSGAYRGVLHRANGSGPVTFRTPKTIPDRWRLSTDLLRFPAGGEGFVVYIVRRANEVLRAAVAENPRLIVVDRGARAVLSQEGEHRVDTASDHVTPRPQASRRGRVPFGRYALMRTLLRTSRPRSQAQLAFESGVSQVAISNGLAALSDAVQRSSEGWSAIDPGRLWARFLEEYPGPGGYASYWFGLDPVRIQASTVFSMAGEVECRLGGDLAADELAPWRRPERAIVYARSTVALGGAGLAEASADEATLEFRIPRDETCWATASAWGESGWVSSRVTDPLLVAWDVLRGGGVDAPDQVDRLREGVLNGWTRT